MNITQKQFVLFLDSAINNKKNSIDSNTKIDWNEIISLANEHKVEALIYSAIDKNSFKYIDKEILEKLKKNTFFTGLKQSQHIKQVENILNVFNKKEIPVVVLKGLLIRELYPKPDLRTMSDADILVYKKDLDKAKNILLSLGYNEHSSSPSHAVYVHHNHLPVEVHWTLADEHFFGNIEKFEKEVWKNLESVKIGDSKALSLGLEDMMLNQCIHMAKHIVYKGFGVRHLTDLVLLVNKNRDIMNWKKFRERSKEYGIEKFMIAIFIICNRLFDLEVPMELYDDKIAKGKFIELLIEDIFSSGVHGKNDVASIVANELAYSYDKDNNQGVLKKFMLKLFPKIDDMSDKYNYAKNNRILWPIAWIHHLFVGVFNKDYSLKEKVSVMTSTISISKKRNDLIEWLEL